MTPRLKKLGSGLAALAAAGVGLVVGFVLFLHTGPGERWVSGKLEDALTGTDLALELDGYHLLWPFRMRASYLRLLDSQGTWLEVVNPEFQWHPFRLLRRTLHVDRLAADLVVVRRLPVASAATPAPSDGGIVPNIHGSLLLDEVSAPIVLADPVLGERVELNLGGTFQMLGGGGMVDVHLRSPGGELIRIAGTAGRDFLDLRWYLRVPDLTRWQRLAQMPLAGEATGAGVIAGRLPSPAVSGQVDVSGGHADAFGWEALALSGRVTPEAGQWRASLRAEAQAPRLGDAPAPVPMAALGLTGDIVPETGQIRLGQLRLETRSVTATASGVLKDWGRDSVLRVHARIPDLAAWTDPGGLGLRGTATMRGQIVGNLLQPALRGQAQMDAAGFVSGQPVLDRLLGNRPHGQAAFAYGNGRLTLADARLRGAKADLRAAGPVGETLALWGKLSVPDLSVFAESLSGAGVVDARISGKLTDPSAMGIAHVAGLAVGAAPPGDGILGFDLAHLAARPQGNLTAALTVAGTALEGSARLDVADAVRVQDLQVVSGDSRLAGDLVMVGGGVRGRLKGTIPELKAWEKLLGRPVSGRIEADAVFDPAQGQSLRLTVNGYDLASHGLTAARADATATLTHLNATPAGTVTVEAGPVALGANRLDRLAASLTGDARAFRFQAEGNGAGARLDGAGSARLNGGAGSARLNGGAGQVALDRLLLAKGGQRAALTSPGHLSWGKDRVTLAPMTLALGPGRLELGGTMAGRSISAHASLDGVPLEMVKLAFPDLDAVGVLSGTAALDGTLDDPRAQMTLTGRNVGFSTAARAGMGRLGVRLDAQWRNGRLDADASAQDGERIRASATGSAPLPGDGPVSGRFELAGDAAALSEALPLAGHVFAGRVDAQGSVAGTMSAPLLGGRAALVQGRYENLENGTVISPLTASASLEDGRVSMEAQGGDGGRGTLRADGAGTLDDYHAQVAFNRFTALRRDEVEAEINGELAVSGQGGDGLIQGKLAVPRAEVDMGRVRGGGPVSLEVVEVNRPNAPSGKPARMDRQSTPVTMRLDVAVAVAHAFVRGRGLDSEWQGNVDVAGNTAQPSLTGRIKAVRGDFDFLGKSFRLSSDSEVLFTGGDQIDPSLNVTAETDAEDITAKVAVTGTAKQPELAITSQPSLPQEEVLARVLFGSELGKLSAFQQIQLAQMAASGLTGRGGGFDPVGKIRGVLGLDVLGVGSAGSDNSGPTLSAGKYLGPNTFVRVDQGTSGLGKVTVEQGLGGGFSVESSVGEQSGGGLGFNWRKNY